MIKLKFKNQKDRLPILSVDEIESSGLLFGDYEDDGLESGDILHLKVVNSAGIVADVDFEVDEDRENAKATEGWNGYLLELPRNPSPVEFGVCQILVNDQTPKQTIVAADEDDWDDEEEEEFDEADDEDDDWSDDEEEEAKAPAKVVAAPAKLRSVPAAPSKVVPAAKQNSSGRFEYLSYAELKYLIDKNGGNKTAAAKEAGCSIDTFRRMLKKAEAARPAKKKAQAEKAKSKSKPKKKSSPAKKAASKKTKSRR